MLRLMSLCPSCCAWRPSSVVFSARTWHGKVATSRYVRNRWTRGLPFPLIFNTLNWDCSYIVKACWILKLSMHLPGWYGCGIFETNPPWRARIGVHEPLDDWISVRIEQRSKNPYHIPLNPDWIYRDDPYIGFFFCNPYISLGRKCHPQKSNNPNQGELNKID